MPEQLAVCCLVPYPPDTVPGQRFRLEQWLPWWKAEGVRVDLMPFADERLMELLYQPGHLLAKAAAMGRAFLRRVRHFACLSRYDAVVIHRTACIVGPALFERAIPLLGKPVIFDFDDAVYLLHTSAANRFFGWLKFPGKTAAICRLCAHVVAGNFYLADYARRHNRLVTVVPTSIDTDRYRPRPICASDQVVVGWTGSSTSQTHLEVFAPLLRKLTSHGDIELRVLSNRKPNLPGIPVVWRPWSAKTEVEEISRFDVGIMPMPDDPWAKGKCALKALQYMSVGIPPVASAVGANCEVIHHGKNGLLAASPEELLAQVLRLVEDAPLRLRLGEAARRTVEEHYSARRCAEQFLQVIRSAVAARLPKPSL